MVRVEDFSHNFGRHRIEGRDVSFDSHKWLSVFVVAFVTAKSVRREQHQRNTSALAAAAIATANSLGSVIVGHCFGTIAINNYTSGLSETYVDTSAVVGRSQKESVLSGAWLRKNLLNLAQLCVIGSVLQVLAVFALNVLSDSIFDQRGLLCVDNGRGFNFLTNVLLQALEHHVGVRVGVTVHLDRVLDLSRDLILRVERKVIRSYIVAM